MRFCLFLGIVFFVFSASGQEAGGVGGNGTPKETLEAKKAWDALVRAKGGRERLYSLSNLLVVDYGLHKNPDAPSITELHVLPYRVWGWKLAFDGSPLAHRSDASVEYWATNKGVTDTVKGDPTNWFAYERVIYLLETKYERPDPVRVSQTLIGKKKYDMIETRWNGRRLDFYYEPEEMLVKKVVYHYPDGSTAETYLFDDYSDVNGIKMPQKIDFNINNEKLKGFYRIVFAFNVDYDPEIFTRPLVATTPDAWKRRP